MFCTPSLAWVPKTSLPDVSDEEKQMEKELGMSPFLVRVLGTETSFGPSPSKPLGATPSRRSPVCTLPHLTLKWSKEKTSLRFNIEKRKEKKKIGFKIRMHLKQNLTSGVRTKHHKYSIPEVNRCRDESRRSVCSIRGGTNFGIHVQNILHN